MKKLLFTLFFSLSVVTSFAYNAIIDGIYYNLDTSEKTAEVTNENGSTSWSGGPYSGDVIIPEAITQNGVTYSVTSIGNSAFSCCWSLTSVAIPNSVKTIGSEAFYMSTNLANVNIPNSLTRIGDKAFFWCMSVSSVTIPSTVVYIGNDAFADCSSLSSFVVDKSNPYYSAEDNVLFNKDKSKLIFCISSKKGEYIIPSSVNTIEEKAFAYCSDLTSVTIPNSVTKIGEEAFAQCSGLTSMTIPNSVTSIQNSVFSDCTSLSSITIPNSVTNIGSSAFANCSSLTSLIIPNSVEKIGSGAFAGCTNLTSLVVDSSNPYFSAEDNVLFNQDKSELLLCLPNKTGAYDIPNSVITIGGSAFYGCTGLTKVTIPTSVKTIESEAFKGCTGLTRVTIPESVTSIGESAFAGCESLSTVKVEWKEPIIITLYTFPRFQSMSLIVPKGTKGLYSASSWGNSFSVSEIKYDAEVDGVYFLLNSSEKTAVVTAETSDWWRPSYIGAVNIPETITVDNISYTVNSIGTQAFSRCSDITSVTLPKSVTSIGEYAFSGCKRLTSIEIPKSVTSLSGDAFYGCDSLVKVKVGWTEPLIVYSNPFPTQEQQIDLYVPAGTKEKYANENYWKKFTNIIEYEDAVVVDGIPYTPDSSTNTVEITNAESGQPTGDVVIPENVTINGNTYTVTSIGENAFSGCSDITSITIPKSVTSIGDYAFANCTSLVEVIVGWDEPLAIPNNVFENVPVNNVRRYKAKSSAITTLYVPKGTKEKYASAEVWKDFSVIQEYEPSSIGCINTDSNAKVFKHFVNGRLIIEKGGKQFTADGIEVK